MLTRIFAPETKSQQREEPEGKSGEEGIDFTLRNSFSELQK